MIEGLKLQLKTEELGKLLFERSQMQLRVETLDAVSADNTNLRKDLDKLRAEVALMSNAIGCIESALGYAGSRPVDKTVQAVAEAVRERDEARYLLSTLHARVSDGHLHTALRAEHSCTAEALDKLRAEVAGLTAALAAAQRERDEARVLLLKCGLWFSTWRRHLLVADTTKEAARRDWDDLEELHNACAAMGGSK